MAYSGNRKRFITTFGVQKSLLDIWNNGYIDRDYDCRIDANPNELNFNDFGWKMILSYFSIGFLAPFLLYSDQNKQQAYHFYNEILNYFLFCIFFSIIYLKESKHMKVLNNH